MDTAKHIELKENIYNSLGLLLKLAKYLDKKKQLQYCTAQ